MTIVLPIMVFACVTSVVLFFYLAGQEREQEVGERLRRLMVNPGKDYSERERLLAEPFVKRLIRPVLKRVARSAAKLAPEEQRERLRNQLALAGYPAGLQVADFLAVKAILAVSLGVLGYLLLKEVLPAQALSAALATGILGYIGPDFLLQNAVRQRQKMIRKALPDVIDLLTVSVEAGLGFDSALAKVIEKMEGPLIGEFSRTLQDMRLGKPRRTALRDLAERTKVDDLATFVTALVQADQLGVSIAKVLRVQSEQMRTRRRQRAEEQALKAPVKMLFPLIIFIFPTIFIILLGPAAIRVMSSL
ncbi:MAG: type II secretion system F family protein [Firmicutes bacterium]|nr:type II secretion system F family protein [Bacillota bacterium]